MKKISVENNINKYYAIIGIVAIMVLITLLVFSIRENTKQYLVQSGTLEYTEITTGYIVKDEQVIEKDKTKVLVPIVAEGARISKGDIIATYKGEEYKNYEETLAEMDKEILELMQDLPMVYSSEVEAIEDSIHLLAKESIGQTSYNKMQEYKQKINTYINKRANIIGDLSPTGAKIKELIKKRNNYEAEAKKSNNNILAPMPGIVSYSVDCLEDKLAYSDVATLDYNNIKERVETKQQVDNTKIKLVNNYEAYIVMKANKENAQYIEEGYNYRLRLIEQDNYEFLAYLEKVKAVDDGIEVYFKVTNGIEHIVNLREVEIEVVWNHAQGLIVPNSALNKYENIDEYYITVIKYSEYQNIPVLVKVESGNYVLVKNYTKEQLQELGLDCEYELKLYDRIIIESKK